VRLLFTPVLAIVHPRLRFLYTLCPYTNSRPKGVNYQTWSSFFSVFSSSLMVGCMCVVPSNLFFPSHRAYYYSTPYSPLPILWFCNHSSMFFCPPPTVTRLPHSVMRRLRPVCPFRISSIWRLPSLCSRRRAGSVFVLLPFRFEIFFSFFGTPRFSPKKIFFDFGTPPLCLPHIES